VDPHDLISQVKTLALELGRTPTRTEFETSLRGGAYKLQRLFGTFAALLQAAGLETYHERRAPKKIDQSIFNRSIEKHLEEYEPRSVIERAPFPTIASISDIHWPFENPKVIAKFLEYVEEKKPEWVILNGDAWDMYSHSKYPRSHNIFTPREEQSLARKRNEEFWQSIQARSPQSKCIQMMGNHDVRPLKRVLEEYPEAEDWVKEKMKELFTFSGVKTIHDAREELVIQDILIFHGYRSKLGDHRDYTLYNTINGHTHLGGVVYRRIRGQTIWELNSGLAGDPESKGLSYTPQKITHWTPGFGAVDLLGPRFIPV
jgi:predicted phosphodiesterase